MQDQDEHDEQIQELFKRLDKNKDGKIDFDELNDYIRQVSNKATGSSSSRHGEQARKLFETIKSRGESGTATPSGMIDNFDFRDFVDYVNRTDKKIELIFKNLDKDENGIDFILVIYEIKQTFANF